jgi:hypothetical protein
MGNGSKCERCVEIWCREEEGSGVVDIVGSVLGTVLGLWCVAAVLEICELHQRRRHLLRWPVHAIFRHLVIWSE